VEGKLAGTSGVEYTHDFFYRPSDLPSRKKTPVVPAVEEPADQESPSDDSE
jgi:hypothetical protein